MSAHRVPRRSFFESLLALPFGFAQAAQRTSPAGVDKVAAGTGRDRHPGADATHIDQLLVTRVVKRAARRMRCSCVLSSERQALLGHEHPATWPLRPDRPLARLRRRAESRRTT